MSGRHHTPHTDPAPTRAAQAAAARVALRRSNAAGFEDSRPRGQRDRHGARSAAVAFERRAYGD